MKKNVDWIAWISIVILGIGSMLLFADWYEAKDEQPTPTEYYIPVISATVTPAVIEPTTTWELYPVPLDSSIQYYIIDKATQRQIPPALIMALIWRESNYKTDVIGTAGEIGLMQIHPVNFKEIKNTLELNDLTNSYQNIKAGVYILDKHLEKYQNNHLALMCYNLGESGAKAQWNKGNYTTEFSRSVINKMIELEAD
jgi:soluble lytic murein transglycosylase-like protein